MTRDTLERHQVWIYLAAIVTGLGLGTAAPLLAPVLDTLLWPVLAVLLYVTFTQARLAHLPAAFRDRRFITAVLLGNFLLLPIVLGAVLTLMPADPALRLGLVLVLLVPCTDWFITFVHQAGGDLRRAIAITPALLVVQMLALPWYLWWFLGEDVIDIVSAERMIGVFGVIIALPLGLAWLTERWAGDHPRRAPIIARLGWLPVPLLALVLMFVAAAQVDTVRGALPLLPTVLLACGVFLAMAVASGVVLARTFQLPATQGRTLVFSLSTRNSFVVLPFALALPPAWETAAVVIVFQSLIELFGMLVLLWLVPRLMPVR